MSYDELKALQAQISAEIVTRPEWKEVTVPAGDWIVGEDIPEGTYSIRPVNASKYINIFVWGAEKDNYTKGGGLIVNDHVGYDKDIIAKLILKKGQIVVINMPVIFAPAQSLGF